MSTNLLILQPYVPHYRVPFFDALDRSLRESNIVLSVLSPVPTGSLALRMDAANFGVWHKTAVDRSLSVHGKTFSRILTSETLAKADGVIAGLVGTSIDTYHCIAKRRSTRGRPLRVGLWGHIDSYVQPANRIDLLLEEYQMRAADHVFAYTERGTSYAQGRGISADKITTLNNTIDTTELQSSLDALTDDSLRQFQKTHAIDPTRCFSYIGALDTAKKIDLLRDTLDIIWAAASDIKIIVGGRGQDESLLDRAVHRGQVISLGHVGARQKALMAKSSVALLNPGRVGLVAVESLVLSLPIVTTEWPFHAPEIDYLTEGHNLFFSNPTAESFAQSAMEMIDRTMDDQRPISPPSLDSMVANFTDGVTKMMR